MNTSSFPLVYIAGPYRAANREAVEFNIIQAKRVGMLAIKKGWMPLIPHANTPHLDEMMPELGDQFWLDGTMALLRRCDAVLLCPGWQYSTGTLAEIAEAERLGMQVFYADPELPLASDFRSHVRVTYAGMTGSDIDQIEVVSMSPSQVIDLPSGESINGSWEKAQLMADLMGDELPAEFTPSAEQIDAINEGEKVRNIEAAREAVIARKD